MSMSSFVLLLLWKPIWHIFQPLTYLELWYNLKIISYLTFHLNWHNFIVFWWLFWILWHFDLFFRPHLHDLVDFLFETASVCKVQSSSKVYNAYAVNIFHLSIKGSSEIMMSSYNYNLWKTIVNCYPIIQGDPKPSGRLL